MSKRKFQNGDLVTFIIDKLPQWAIQQYGVNAFESGGKIVRYLGSYPGEYVVELLGTGNQKYTVHLLPKCMEKSDNVFPNTIEHLEDNLLHLIDERNKINVKIQNLQDRIDFVNKFGLQSFNEKEFKAFQLISALSNLQESSIESKIKKISELI